jgi:hypothetical protein
MVALRAHLGLCAIGTHFQNRHAALFAAVCLENVLGDVPKSVDVGASRSKSLCLPTGGGPDSDQFRNQRFVIFSGQWVESFRRQ